MKKLLWTVLLAGCATTASVETKAAVAVSKDEAALIKVKGAIAALPKCAAGADVGHLEVRAAMCTKMFCDSACCNQCTWAATYQAMSGAREADKARVMSLLGVPDAALDCEIAAWGKALEGQSVAFDPPSCVVR